MPGGKLQRVGALWLKEGKNGKFFSGTFEPRRGGLKYQILVFRNRDKDPKTNPKAPDYQIMMAEPEVRSEADDRQEDPSGPPEI